MMSRAEPCTCLWLAAMALLAPFGCVGYRTPLDQRPRAVSTTSADASLDGRHDVAADRRDLGSDTRDLGARVFKPCTIGEHYVLALGLDDNLYRFHPDTLALDLIAPVECGTPSGYYDTSLNSLTTSPVGPAYISNHAGELCIVDLVTFTAKLTSFDPARISRNSYGMALLPDSSPAGQSLYVANNIDYYADRLSRIDLTSYALTDIGAIGINGQPINEAELTAGPHGELYVFSVSSDSMSGISFTPSQLLTLDPTNASVRDVTDVPVASPAPAFALVNWQGTFYLFFTDSDGAFGNASTATVYTYPAGGSVTKWGTIGVGIIGAGVARCQ